MKKTIHKIAAALIATAAMFLGACDSRQVLHVYMWSDYIDLDMVKEFEKQNNCKVVIDTFDSNESMFAKMKAGASGYDVINPTSYMAKIMYEQKMLETLNHAKLPNLKNVDKNYLNDLALDKNMTYSVPYMLGYTCIAYNKAKLGKIDNSWSIFENKAYNKKMTLLNDYRETIGAALFYLGYDMNTTNDAQIKEARDLVIKWKKNISSFDNESYKGSLADGSALIVQGYSGDLFQILAENKDLDYMCPKEGISMSCDNWVIPTNAKSKDLAYKFINFVCEPKVAAKNMEASCYSAPIPEARKYVSEENKNHAGMFIPAELYKRGKLIEDLGEDKNKYEKAWDDIKLAK